MSLTLSITCQYGNNKSNKLNKKQEKIRKLNYALGKKVHKAMIVCDPKIKKEECEVLWEEIEDISKQLILMKKKKDLEDLDFHI